MMILDLSFDFLHGERRGRNGSVLTPLYHESSLCFWTFILEDKKSKETRKQTNKNTKTHKSPLWHRIIFCYWENIRMPRSFISLCQISSGWWQWYIDGYKVFRCCYYIPMLIFGDNDCDSYFDDMSDLKEIDTTTMMIMMTMMTLIDYIANFGDVEEIMIVVKVSYLGRSQSQSRIRPMGPWRHQTGSDRISTPRDRKDPTIPRKSLGNPRKPSETARDRRPSLLMMMMTMTNMIMIIKV